jgi:hypothetical protein
MMRRTTIVLALLLVLGAVSPAPVAGQPQTVEESDFLVVAFFDHGVVVFANIDRATWCAWAQSGFGEAAFPDQPLPVRYHEVGRDALARHIRADLAVEVWAPREGSFEIEDLCDASAAHVASGHGSLVWNDNDWDVTLTRNNSFGGGLSATVLDDDGRAWQVRFSVRFHIDRDGEFHLRSRHTTFVPTGRTH